MSWDVVRLGDIGESIIGLTYSPDNIKINGIPVLRSGNIQNARLDFSDIVRVQQSFNESLLLREDDILICARNGSKNLIGKSALVTGLPEPMTFGAFMTVFRSPYNRYIVHFLQSEGFRQQLSRSSTNTINQLTQDILLNIEIPLPPLDEQRRIAAEIERQLAIVEKAKQAAMEQLVAARALNAAYMREVFDGNDWDAVELGEICTLFNGNAYNDSDWSAIGIPIIRIQNLNDHLKPFNYWAGLLDNKVVINDGDLLLAWSGTPGTSFGAHIWTRGKAVLNQHIFKVIVTANVNCFWLRVAINQELDAMIGKAHGAVGLRHITKKETERLKVSIPPLDEQHNIVEQITKQSIKTENIITAIQSQLDIINAMPAAILRQALSGQM
jgi:type I restriction enzyme S subunit